MDFYRTFDHWAHLGGAAFGIAYYKFGPQSWHYLRDNRGEKQTVLG